MLIWVVDIDGTIADTRPRINAICKKFNVPENKWTEEQVREFTNPDLIKEDKIINGAEKLADLARICGAKLVFLTGRSEMARRPTRIWLENKLNIFDSVPLVMRPDGDMRPTATCKEDVFLKSVYQVYKDAKFIFFEDEELLLRKYAKYGLSLKAPECWSVIRYALLPLSKEEQERRKPLPPEMLVGALQDKIHKDVGKFIASKIIKVKK